MDDQQARDQMIETLADITYRGKDTGHGFARVIVETFEQMGWTPPLAALPVASRSDIPEQPTQASGFWDSPAGHVLAVLRAEVGGWSRDTLAARKVIDLIDSLVSSPSVETVTPNRETIIREVLDWLEGYQPIAHAWDEAREHFGVSS